MPLVIDPATQPLTISASTGPQDTQQAVMHAYRTSPDDGVLLMYQIPGYAHPRTEIVIVSAAIDTPLVSGGAEVRRVWTPSASFEETALNGALGPFGSEWSSSKGEVQPSLGMKIAGTGVQLQPGQLMAGIVNPMGPGGVRAGAEWRVESTKTFITTRQYLEDVGGVSRFGARFAGQDARLLRQDYQQRRGRLSGIEYLRLYMYYYNIPYEEQP